MGHILPFVYESQRPGAPTPPKIFRLILLDPCYRCEPVLGPTCLLMKPILEYAGFQTTVPLLAAYALICPTDRFEIEKYRVRECFGFLFRNFKRQTTFDLMLPTLDQLKTFLKNFSSYSQCSLVGHLPCKPSFCFFNFFRYYLFLPLCRPRVTIKTFLPIATVKLKHRVGLKTKTIHGVPSNHPFPSMPTHLLMNVNIPLLGLVFQPEDCFFSKRT